MGSEMCIRDRVRLPTCWGGAACLATAVALHREATTGDGTQRQGWAPLWVAWWVGCALGMVLAFRCASAEQIVPYLELFLPAGVLMWFTHWWQDKITERPESELGSLEAGWGGLAEVDGMSSLGTCCEINGESVRILAVSTCNSRPFEKGSEVRADGRADSNAWPAGRGIAAGSTGVEDRKHSHTMGEPARVLAGCECHSDMCVKGRTDTSAGPAGSRSPLGRQGLKIASTPGIWTWEQPWGLPR